MVARFMFASLLFVAGLAQAAPSARLNVNGSLLNASDRPVQGVQRMTFGLYSTATGGSAFFVETLDVEFVNGLFHAELGSTKPLAPELLIASKDGIWVGIRVADTAELSPRLQVGTVPLSAWAHRAGKSDLADEATHAAKSDNALRAARADEADLAVKARRAEDADRADAAALAERATSADYALAAGRAEEAALADVATRALTADTLGDDDASSFRRVGVPVPFGELTGVPAGLLDGDDDLLASLECSNGQVPVSTQGQWVCARPFTNRACEAGKVVSGVDMDGNLICAADKDSNTTYSAGSGLTLVGTSFSLDAGCARDEVLKSDGSGGWACRPDNDSKNFAQVSKNCPEGQVMVGITSTGLPSCSSIRDYVNSNCHLYAGWSDNCTDNNCVGPTNYVKVRADACSGSKCDPAVDGRSTMGGTALRVGWLQLGGKVDDNDRLFFAFKCD